MYRESNLDQSAVTQAVQPRKVFSSSHGCAPIVSLRRSWGAGRSPNDFSGGPAVARGLSHTPLPAASLRLDSDMTRPHEHLTSSNARTRGRVSSRGALRFPRTGPMCVTQTAREPTLMGPARGAPTAGWRTGQGHADRTTHGARLGIPHPTRPDRDQAARWAHNSGHFNRHALQSQGNYR